jgi:cyclopropane-fatty-acyl-phospholipid synthase
MARHYPASQITSVSNSKSQRDFILAIAKKENLSNLNVITCDMNNFDIKQQFDRIVSVEMFEHMRNYQVLFEKINSWLAPQGQFFMHIFCHRDVPYAFEVQGDDDWMSQFFFSGGFMPSDDTPSQFQSHLKLSRQWRWDGRHYEKTANAWLTNMDDNEAVINGILAECYGPENVVLWRQRWRIFFMACAELFGYQGGQEWWVSHYLFEKNGG